MIDTRIRNTTVILKNARSPRTFFFSNTCFRLFADNFAKYMSIFFIKRSFLTFILNTLLEFVQAVSE